MENHVQYNTWPRGPVYIKISYSTTRRVSVDACNINSWRVRHVPTWTRAQQGHECQSGHVYNKIMYSTTVMSTTGVNPDMCTRETCTAHHVPPWTRVQEKYLQYSTCQLWNVYHETLYSTPFVNLHMFTKNQYTTKFVYLDTGTIGRETVKNESSGATYTLRCKFAQYDLWHNMTCLQSWMALYDLCQTRHTYKQIWYRSCTRVNRIRVQ